ncbi:hypothetical protein NQ318_017454 [Aromia moschata]|uniref:ZAD domain-containing protein n=1 Tax=Aromia moschata TaxID=1265417 RepID=A0AAV8Z4L2_9CUCU|nr:hypothetical protein NQ318_017454 [Aromia moschata]
MVKNQHLDIDIQNFPNMCRACLQLGDVKPLINSKITTTLKSITNIEIVADDNLPKNLCYYCIKQLEEISVFAETFKTNDARLEEFWS